MLMSTQYMIFIMANGVLSFVIYTFRNFACMVECLLIMIYWYTQDVMHLQPLVGTQLTHTYIAIDIIPCLYNLCPTFFISDQCRRLSKQPCIDVWIALTSISQLQDSSLIIVRALKLIDRLLIQPAYSDMYLLMYTCTYVCYSVKSFIVQQVTTE